MRPLRNFIHVLKNAIVFSLFAFRNYSYYKKYVHSSSIRLTKLLKEISFSEEKTAFSKIHYQVRIWEEIYILSKLEKYLDSVDLFVDIGDNVGMTSIAYHYICSGKTEVAMVEPMTTCGSLLRKLSKSNLNARFYECALGHKNENKKFKRSLSSPTSSFVIS